MREKPLCAGFVSIKEMPLRVPVSVTPRVHAGNVRVFCCGAPRVMRAENGCGYVLRQHLCADIPLRVGASAAVGEVKICPGQQNMEWGTNHDQDSSRRL